MSEKTMQLVCFPYMYKTQAAEDEVVDCLVLPELLFFLDVFLNVNLTETITLPPVKINRYLLVLILLWTKQDVHLYSDRFGQRRWIILPDVTNIKETHPVHKRKSRGRKEIKLGWFWNNNFRHKISERV